MADSERNQPQVRVFVRACPHEEQCGQEHRRREETRDVLPPVGLRRPGQNHRERGGRSAEDTVREIAREVLPQRDAIDGDVRESGEPHGAERLHAHVHRVAFSSSLTGSS